MSLPERCLRHAPGEWAEPDAETLRRMRGSVGLDIQQTITAMRECAPDADPARATYLAWRLVELSARWRELTYEGGA